MNLILKPFHGQAYLQNKIFTSCDDGKNIFYKLDKIMAKKGISIITADIKNPSEVDYYIFCDVPYPWEIRYWILLLKNQKKSILFCFESPIINPFSHLRFIQKLFKLVYSWEDANDLPVNVIKFYIPQTNKDLNVPKVSFNHKSFLIMVNSFKSSYPYFNILSRYKIDLYKTRLKAVNFFEKKIGNNFSLYGKGWSTDQYKSHRGYTDNKIQTLRHFKYCLCFENNPAPGYISEKIFDCFKAKCVPIYLGAPNICDYIPSSSFIDFRSFSNFDDLLFFLESISEKQYEKYLKSANKFMLLNSTQNIWFEDGFIKSFMQAMS